VSTAGTREEISKKYFEYYLKCGSSHSFLLWQHSLKLETNTFYLQSRYLIATPSITFWMEL